MRSAILLLSICLFTVATLAQEGNFTLVFTPGANAQKVSKYYLHYSNNGKRVQDSAQLIQDKVTFNGKISNPANGRIMLVLPQPSGSNLVEFVNVILEPGTINVDATAGFDAARYSGTATQREFDEWQSGLSPLYKESRKNWTKLFEYRNKKDKENEIKVQDDIKATGARIMKFQEDFMRRNNKSIVTALMLKDYVSPVWENLVQAEQIYNNLDPKLKELPDVQKFGKELQIALTLAQGKTYPDFSLPDSTGRMVSLAAYKGKYVLIDFWASWCGPCRQESPALVAAYNKYKGKGFDIFSVSFDTDQSKWLKAVATDQYTWTNVVDTTGMGPSGTLSSRFNIMAIPRNFLLDKNGKIIATNLRGEELERKLKEVFGS